MTDSLVVDLPWDSSFWGVPTARLMVDRLTPDTVRQVIAEADERGIRLIYFLARPDDAVTRSLAVQAGFSLVDVRVEFERALGGAPRSAELRSLRETDLPDLIPIARTAYTLSRFFADEHLPNTRCEEFYEAWLRRSAEGWANAVLVAEIDGRAAGFISLHHGEKGQAQIGLVGVSAAARGRGTGQQLVDGGLAWCTARDVRTVTVVTQGANVASQRLYQRCGFLTRSVGLWYHGWLAGPDRE